MSGGSFNYLHRVQWEIERILDRDEDIEQMAQLLVALNADDAARETSDLLAAMREFRALADRHTAALADVWQAAEWIQSGDWGPEQIEDALVKYREVK